MRQFLILLLALVVTACSDSYDDYIGHWNQREGTDILTIKKEDSNTYLLVRDILSSGEQEEFVLEKNANGYFEITISFFGVGKLPLMLSDKGQILRLDNKVYQKIDSSKVDETIAYAKACRKLASDYLEEAQAVSYKDQDRRTVIKEKYVRLQDNIPNCNIANYVFNF